MLETKFLISVFAIIIVVIVIRAVITAKENTEYRRSLMKKQPGQIRTVIKSLEKDIAYLYGTVASGNNVLSDSLTPTGSGTGELIRLDKINRRNLAYLTSCYKIAIKVLKGKEKFERKRGLRNEDGKRKKLESSA